MGAGKHTRSKAAGHPFRTAIILILCFMAFSFGIFLWNEALTMPSAGSSTTDPDETFRPTVGLPPYRVVVDAGHGGSDPGARGVVEEKAMTAATAAALVRWLEQDSNYIPLGTRDSYDTTTTPSERAAAANAQSPDLLLSIHGNSAGEGSTASGFECYPTVPGRTWHRESFYFAEQLAKGMEAAGARLRGKRGVRYIYYLENDQKQLVETTHTEVRAERSFTILENVDCPAVLAEQCFVTSAEDVERFGSEAGCQLVARVYYEAICTYFGTEPLPNDALD